MNKIYIRRVLAVCVAVVLGSAAANYLVDPYGLYRFVDREGFNRHKPKAGTSGFLVKPYAVERIRPKTLLLGNSRDEAGFDPESSIWPEAYRPVYNMAFPGSGIDTALKSLRHVDQLARPETVILGVDFMYFAATARSSSRGSRSEEPSEFDKRLLIDGEGRARSRDSFQRAKDTVSALVSLNALLDSAMTVAVQKQRTQPDLTPWGFNPMREFERYAKTDGYPTIFRQVETTYLTSYLREPRFLYGRDGKTSDALDQLRAVIRICREKGIRLHIYIPPYHARMLECYRAAGYWPMFEEWKRALVRAVEEEAVAASVDLWDFSGYNEITAETVPTMKERGRLMQGYWEVGHYNSAVGDRVLRKILALGGRADGAPAGFGVKLTSHNVESQTLAIRGERERYAAAHEDEIRAIQRLADGLRSRLKPRTQ